VRGPVRPDGNIVTLTTTTKPDALTIVALLKSNGITAMVSGTDADGWYPHLGFAAGYPVLVFEEDVDEATRILEMEPPPPPVQ
jgi:hypothetical protein